MDLVYVSLNTLTEDLKAVDIYLSHFQLSLERLPSRGLIVAGSEYKKRVCLQTSWQTLSTLLPDQLSQSERENLEKIVSEQLAQAQLNMSHSSLLPILQQLEIALLRCKKEKQVTLDRKAIDFVLTPEFAQLGQVIVQRINGQFESLLTEDDGRILAISLMTKLSSYALEHAHLHPIIVDGLNLQIERIFDKIRQEFSLDLSHNATLQKQLFLHLFAMTLRIKYDIYSQHPMVYQLKQNYSFSYMIAKTAAEVLEAYFEKQIPDDEIGFLAMIFSSAVDYGQTISKNILLISPQASSSRQFYRMQFEHYFGTQLNHIYETTTENLADFPFDVQQIDVIFSPVPLTEQVPVEVIETPLVMTDEELAKYKQLFFNNNQAALTAFYQEDYFFPHLTVKDKETAIKMLIDKLDLTDSEKSDFYQSVLRREERVATDISGLAATPHPEQPLFERNFVEVGLLDKPILWHDYKVSLVILVHLKKGNQPDLELFYRKTSSFLFNKDKITALKRQPTFSNFITLISN